MTKVLQPRFRWWTRYAVRAGIWWYMLTFRKIDYDRVCQFAIRYGMYFKEPS